MKKYTTISKCREISDFLDVPKDAKLNPPCR